MKRIRQKGVRSQRQEIKHSPLNFNGPFELVLIIISIYNIQKQICICNFKYIRGQQGGTKLRRNVWKMCTLQRGKFLCASVEVDKALIMIQMSCIRLRLISYPRIKLTINIDYPMANKVIYLIKNHCLDINVIRVSKLEGYN